MVKVPVPTTLATAEPLMHPISAEATTAARAGPQRSFPVTDRARSLIKLEQPEASKKAPNITNIKMVEADTEMVVPKMPSRSTARYLKISVRV